MTSQLGGLVIATALSLAHYGPPPCPKDETQLIIQQASNWVGCFTKCSTDADCPQKTRQAEPAIQSVIKCSINTGESLFCGETCASDAECDTASGAACRDGLCLFPSIDQWPKSWQWHILPVRPPPFDPSPISSSCASNGSRYLHTARLFT